MPNVNRSVLPRRYEPGEAIVKLKDSAALASASFGEEHDIDIVERFDFGRRSLERGGDLVRVKLPEGMSVEAGLKFLEARPDVEYAGPNNRIYLDEPLQSQARTELEELPEDSRPDDLHYKLWGLENRGHNFGKKGADIEALEAWKTNVGDRENGPIIAIIDSGVDVSHPYLVDNLWVNPGEIPGDGIDNDGNGVVDDVHGYNAYHNNADLSDGKVHGTHVAGTVGATGNNGRGITGVAQRARLMPIKIFGKVGHTNEATVLRGLAYADRMGARITTNSWGGIASQAMEEAYARSPALHIASAGNSGRDNDREPHFPGSYPIDNMVAVAATDNKDRLGSFSCYGEKTVHLGAPGQDIYSTLPRDRYRSFSGTSMACPHVAGVASLILSEYPKLSNQQVKERLLYGTEPLPDLEGKTVSGGRLNARLALESDKVSPGRVTDFSAHTTPGEVSLSWKAAGDDGLLGTARRVELKRCERPLTEKNFADSGTLLPLTEAKAPGQVQGYSEKFALERRARELYYGLVSVDNVGNRSQPAILKTVIPAAEVVFEDGEETVWQTTGEWARVQNSEGDTVWADSPNGDYGYERRSSITSPVVSLGNEGAARLKFQSKLKLASGDYLRIQVRDQEGRWMNEGLLKGEAGWSEHEVGLERYQGQSVQVRFELQSDSAHNADGVYLNGIEILSTGRSTRD